MSSETSTLSPHQSASEPRVRQQKRPDKALYVPKQRQLKVKEAETVKCDSPKNNIDAVKKKTKTKKSRLRQSSPNDSFNETQQSKELEQEVNLIDEKKQTEAQLEAPLKNLVDETQQKTNLEQAVSLADEKKQVAPPLEVSEKNILDETQLSATFEQEMSFNQEQKQPDQKLNVSPRINQNISQVSNVSPFNDTTPSPQKLYDAGSDSPDEDSWESNFTEDGECLKPELLNELESAVGKVKISKVTENYEEYSLKDISLHDKEFGHIVELYDFPEEFKNEDLMTILRARKKHDLNIKWVNDTHALAVCSGILAAEELLNINHPMLKLRPLYLGTSESKRKARNTAEFVQPFKPRPETSVNMARRVIANSLGLKANISKEERDLERQQLRQFKAKNLNWEFL